MILSNYLIESFISVRKEKRIEMHTYAPPCMGAYMLNFVIFCDETLLSKPKVNANVNNNSTKLEFDMKMTLHLTPLSIHPTE